MATALNNVGDTNIAQNIVQILSKYCSTLRKIPKMAKYCPNIVQILLTIFSNNIWPFLTILPKYCQQYFEKNTKFYNMSNYDKLLSTIFYYMSNYEKILPTIFPNAKYVQILFKYYLNNIWTIFLGGSTIFGQYFGQYSCHRHYYPWK